MAATSKRRKLFARFCLLVIILSDHLAACKIKVDFASISSNDRHNTSLFERKSESFCPKTILKASQRSDI